MKKSEERGLADVRVPSPGFFLFRGRELEVKPGAFFRKSEAEMFGIGSGSG